MEEGTESNDYGHEHATLEREFRQPTGHVLTAPWSQSSQTGVYGLGCECDGVGNRLAKVESGARTESSYNAAHELVRVQPPAGAPTTLTWDGNGNLAREETGSAVTVYTWNERNRLAAVATQAATRVPG